MSAESLGYLFLVVLIIGIIVRTIYVRRRKLIATEFFVAQAIALFERGNYKDAKDHFDIALKLSPRHPHAKEGREFAVKALDSLSKLNSAFSLQQEDRESAPDSLDDLQQRLKRSSGDEALDRLGKGGAKHLLGDNESALEELNTAIELKPNYPEAYGLRGQVKSSLGKFDEAIVDFDCAIRLIREASTVAHPNAESMCAANFFYRATAKFYLKQYAGAIADYDSALRVDCSNAVAYVRRGGAKCQLGENMSALADLNSAIELNPTYPEAYGLRGQLKSNLGQYDEAIVDFDYAIRLIQDAPEEDIHNADSICVGYGFARAEAKNKLKQYMGAIADYDAIISLQPSNADAYFRRGIAKGFLNDRKSEAFTDLHKSLDLAEEQHNTELRRKILTAMRNLE